MNEKSMVLAGQGWAKVVRWTVNFCQSGGTGFRRYAGRSIEVSQGVAKGTFSTFAGGGGTCQARESWSGRGRNMEENDMKSVASLAIAALLAISIPFPGLAQDAESTDPMLTANYGSLISSLQAAESADVSTFAATSTVNCVKVSTLMADAAADAAALDTAITENSAEANSLKSSINSNADLKAKLEAASCPIDDVVAVTSEADGHLTVYVDDRA